MERIVVRVDGSYDGRCALRWAVLEREIRSVEQSGLPEPVQAVLVHGAAPGAPVDAAQGADLLVVGTRGLGGFSGLPLGSASHQVTHHATCPVVIVRPDQQ